MKSNDKPHNYTEQDYYLRYLAEKGLKKLGKDTQEYRDRLLMEWEVISKMGFSSYYLVVADYVGWAKRNGIPVGPGRGSGAGSLVAYAVGITDVDSIKHGLMFERFLNPGRVSMPDFDIDFCMRRRNEVINYVIGKYGEAQTARIGTFGKMKAKLAVRDTARVMGLDPETIDRYGKIVPKEARGGQGDHAVTLAKCLKAKPDHEDPKLKDFWNAHTEDLLAFKKAYDQDKNFQEVVNRAIEIEGVPKSAGVHAAGVIIWDKPLVGLVPLALKKAKDKAEDDDEDDYSAEEEQETYNVVATQWSDKQVEAVGLVKYDFLGLRTLTIIQDALDSIERRTGKKIDWNEVDDNDPATYAMLSEGDCFGVFQLTEDGMRGFVRGFKPNSIEDISTISALYRPGPLDNGMVQNILQVRSGRMEPQYPLEALRGILEPTNGVLTYQEQVLAIARVMAGYSLSEADLLRRAIGKKLPVEMEQQRIGFTEGSVKLGYSRRVSEEMFAVIEKFADYCFNKSHSIAYSILSFRTAWLKCHYPADFYAANMSNYDTPDKVTQFILDAKKHNIKVLPPDINLSGLSFTAIDDTTVRFGLLAIKGCGNSAIDDLISKRKNGKFLSLIDVCQRIDPSCVKKNNLEALSKSGALDGIEPLMNRLEILQYIPGVMESVKGDHKANKLNQMTMFDTLFAGDANAGLQVLRPKVHPDFKEILENERAVLNLYISAHPLDLYSRIKDQMDIDEVASLEVPDLYVTLLVMIKSVYVRNGKNGTFAFLTLEDSTGQIEAKVWSRAYNEHQYDLVEGACVIVGGRTNFYKGIEVVVDSIIPAERELARTSKPITIFNLTPVMMNKIALLPQGKTPIDLEVGALRYRLGHFNVPPDFLTQLER